MGRHLNLKKETSNPTYGPLEEEKRKMTNKFLLSSDRIETKDFGRYWWLVLWTYGSFGNEIEMFDSVLNDSDRYMNDQEIFLVGSEASLDVVSIPTIALGISSVMTSLSMVVEGRLVIQALLKYSVAFKHAHSISWPRMQAKEYGLFLYIGVLMKSAHALVLADHKRSSY
ncbi:hypothetical protein VNO77_34371 [Canavalia gladiata]|uniref:Uncharacterized protein n=1 Tax=Canavalia gladiata TaxID=3824 RepID=A0AAN9KEX8_CANGL